MLICRCPRLTIRPRKHHTKIICIIYIYIILYTVCIYYVYNGCNRWMWLHLSGPVCEGILHVVGCAYITCVCNSAHVCIRKRHVCIQMYCSSVGHDTNVMGCFVSKRNLMCCKICKVKVNAMQRSAMECDAIEWHAMPKTRVSIVSAVLNIKWCNLRISKMVEESLEVKLPTNMDR